MKYRVGSKWFNGWFVTPLVFAAGFAILAFYAGSDGFTPLITIAAICLSLAVIAGIVTARNLRFVDIEDDGFVFTDRHGTRRVKDADVRDVSLSVDRNYSQGIATSVTYRVQLWAGDASSPPMIVTHKAALEGEDAVEQWLHRVRNNLAVKSKADIDAGSAVTGEDWQLSKATLNVKVSGRNISMRIDEISASDFLDNNALVWKVGEDDPVVRIPGGARNAWLLLALLPDMIPKRPEESEPQPGMLGRVLFERKWRNPLAFFLFVVCLILVVGGGIALVMYFTFPEAENPPNLFSMSAASVVVGLVIGWFAFDKKLMSRAFRCHEWGLKNVAWGKDQQMRYGDVDTFTYQATRLFVNGVYSGTNVAMIFQSKVEPGPKRITYSYSTGMGGVDQSVELLRDHISKVIARKMLDVVTNGGEVQWASGFVFTPNGLKYTKGGILSKKQAIEVPYAEVERYNVNEGVLSLWRSGEASAIVQMPVSQPNFFPGFFLLEFVIASLKDQAAQQAQPAPQPSQ